MSALGSYSLSRQNSLFSFAITDFAKELSNFKTKLQNSDRRATRLAKLWANCVHRILSNKKTMDKSIKGAQMAAREVE